MLRFAIMFSCACLLASAESKAAFFYTTSIDYAGSVEQPYIDIPDSGGSTLYSQDARGSQTGITGSGMINVGQQALMYRGNSASFQTRNQLSYNIVITNKSTGNFKSIKIGIGTIGTIGEPDETFSLDSRIEELSDSVFSVSLDGIDFTVGLDESGLGSYFGKVNDLPLDTPIYRDLNVSLTVVGLASVPEPSSLILMVVGASAGSLGVGLGRRRLAATR